MNLEKVLKDLNAEKRWLEGVIGALEIAGSSPAHRLIRSLDQSIWNGGRRRGLHLGPRKRTELSKLARMVQNNSGRCSRRGEP